MELIYKLEDAIENTYKLVMRSLYVIVLKSRQIYLGGKMTYSERAAWCARLSLASKNWYLRKERRKIASDMKRKGEEYRSFIYNTILNPRDGTKI